MCVSLGEASAQNILAGLGHSCFSRVNAVVGAIGQRCVQPGSRLFIPKIPIPSLDVLT